METKLYKMEIKNRRKEGKSMANLMFAAGQVMMGKTVEIVSLNGRRRVSVMEAKKILNL